MDRDVQRRCSWTPHSRIAVLSSKGTPVLSSHPSPTSSGHLNILHTCHRTESSSYWKPSRMSESRTPEFLSRLKLHTLLTWESPPHTVSMFPQLSVALITRYILDPTSAHPSQHLLCRGHHPSEMWGIADPCPPRFPGELRSLQRNPDPNFRMAVETPWPHMCSQGGVGSGTELPALLSPSLSLFPSVVHPPHHLIYFSQSPVF